MKIVDRLKKVKPLNRREKVLFVALMLTIGIAVSSQFVYEYKYREVTLVINEGMFIGDRTSLGNKVYFYVNDKLVSVVSNNMTNLANNTYIPDHLFNNTYTETKLDYIAVGSGTDDASPHNNVALVTEEDRQSGTYYKPADTYEWGLNTTHTGISGTIKEAGILSESTAGILAFYVNDLNIALNPADTLKVCWKGDVEGN